MRFATPTAAATLSRWLPTSCWISPGAMAISSAPGPGSTSGNRYGSIGSSSITSIPAREASRAIRADSGSAGQHRHRERAPDLAEDVEHVTAAAEVVDDDGHPGRARGQRRRLRERARERGGGGGRRGPSGGTAEEIGAEEARLAAPRLPLIEPDHRDQQQNDDAGESLPHSRRHRFPPPA